MRTAALKAWFLCYLAILVASVSGQSLDAIHGAYLGCFDLALLPVNTSKVSRLQFVRRRPTTYVQELVMKAQEITGADGPLLQQRCHVVQGVMQWCTAVAQQGQLQVTSTAQLLTLRLRALTDCGLLLQVAKFSSKTLTKCMPYCYGERYSMHAITQSYQCHCIAIVPAQKASLPDSACSAGGKGTPVFYRFRGTPGLLLVQQHMDCDFAT